MRLRLLIVLRLQSICTILGVNHSWLARDVVMGLLLCVVSCLDPCGTSQCTQFEISESLWSQNRKWIWL
jgi:hypothetical protein